jgi:thioredoxin-like negative regulator of GroEL
VQARCPDGERVSPFASRPPAPAGFHGQSVVFTGKLSSLSRKEACSLVVRLGGAAHDEVTLRTTMLIVGAEGFQAGEGDVQETGTGEGRSHKLRKAAAINTSTPGHIRIVSETEFCELAGVPTPEALRRQYSGWRDLATLYPALREDRLRYLQKWKLVRPVVRTNAELYFGFSDVAIIREANAELTSGVPFRAVVRALHARRTGQLALDFRGDAEPAKIIRLARRAGPELPVTAYRSSPAEDAFLAASRMDDGDPSCRHEVARAYRRALELDPELVPALINLGNLYYSQDELVEAQALYERALGLDPDVFEAHFNLGNVHHDLGRLEEARECYAQAVTLDPTHADAHFYLAVTLEKLGRSQDAKPHWRAYQRLAPDGEWVELAREFSE